MASYDDLDTNRIFTVGIFSVVVTAVTALAVQVVYYALEQSQKEIKSAQSNYGRQNRILAAQSDEISQYGVDETTGNYTIPVDKAMTLMLANTDSDHDGDHSNSESKASGDAGKAEAGHSEVEKPKEEPSKADAEAKASEEKETDGKDPSEAEEKPEAEVKAESESEEKAKTEESNENIGDKDEA